MRPLRYTVYPRTTEARRAATKALVPQKAVEFTKVHVAIYA